MLVLKVSSVTSRSISSKFGQGTCIAALLTTMFIVFPHFSTCFSTKNLHCSLDFKSIATVKISLVPIGASATSLLTSSASACSSGRWAMVTLQPSLAKKRATERPCEKLRPAGVLWSENKERASRRGTRDEERTHNSRIASSDQSILSSQSSSTFVFFQVRLSFIVELFDFEMFC